MLVNISSCLNVIASRPSVTATAERRVRQALVNASRKTGSRELWCGMWCEAGLEGSEKSHSSNDARGAMTVVSVVQRGVNLAIASKDSAGFFKSRLDLSPRHEV